MHGSLSVIFSDVYMTKTEHKVANSSKPKFYKRFTDNIINRRNKNQPDDLSQKLSKYELYSWSKAKDFSWHSKDAIATKVKRNGRKLPVHWSSRFQHGIKRTLSLVIWIEQHA